MNSDPNTQALDAEALMRHDAWLRPFVRSILGDGQQVDDVLQETWMTALRRPPAEAGALRTWLTQVARRFALRQQRSDRRRRSHEAGAAQTEALPSTEETVQEFAAQRFVTTAITNLAEPYRATVILRYHHEIAIREIAERMDTSEANVRQRLKRGMDKLRRRCEKEYGTDWRASSALLGLAGLRNAAVAVKTTTPFLLGALLMKPYTSATAILAILLLAWFSPGVTGKPSTARAVGIPSADTSTDIPDATDEAERKRIDTIPDDNTVPEPTVVLSGTVYGLDGQPIADVPVGNAVDNVTQKTATATVRAFDATPEDGVTQASKPPFTTLTRTDHLGRFTLETVSFQNELFAGPGYVTMRSVQIDFEDEHRDDIVLIVARALTVSGDVVDETGLAVPFVNIHQSEHDFQDFPIDLEASRGKNFKHHKTDSKGHFELNDVAAGTGHISFEALGYDRFWFRDISRSQTNARIVLRKSTTLTTLRGTVIDHRGQLVVGARVGKGQQSTRTDGNGRFELTMERNQLRNSDMLYACKPGLQSKVIYLLRHFKGTQGQEDQPLEVQLGGPTRHISGRVVYADGTPWHGVLVYPTDLKPIGYHKTAEGLSLADNHRTGILGGNPANLDVLAQTAADGTFSLAGLCDRSYALRVYHLKTGLVLDCGDYVAGREDIVLTMPEELYFETVRIRVLSLDGKALEGVKIGNNVESSRFRGGITSYVVMPLGRTDNEGVFVADHLPRFDTQVSISGPSIMPMNVTIGPRADRGTLYINAPRRAKYRLRLTEGRAPHAQVSAFDAHGKLQSQYTFAEYGHHGDKTAYIPRSRSTGVRTVSETVTTLVIERAGEILARIPVVLHAGELTEVEW